MASNCEGRGEEEQWSELPVELLEVIFNKLRPISDCIHFGGVCKSWRLAASQQQQRRHSTSLHPQLPLLLIPDQLPFTGSCSLFSLSTNSIHTLSLPEACRKTIVASSQYGWLLLADITTKEICLLNPITQAQIQLPLLPEECYTEVFGTNLRLVLPRDGIISSSPTSSSAAEHDCIVMVITCRRWTFGTTDLHLCRPGRDKVWTKLQTSHMVDSIVYNKGRFYMLDVHGVVTVCDAANPSVEILSLPAPAFAQHYFLVKASETELLISALPYAGTRFRLFKVDLSAQPLEWSEIDSIADKALFLTPKKCSCSMVCARDLPGCKQDCIYYDTPSYYDDFSPQKQVHIVQVINIKERSYEFLQFTRKGPPMIPLDHRWFTPSLY